MAITDANDTPGADAIHFNIPGAPPFTIVPLTALPGVADPVVIDGTTQPGYSGTPVVGLVGTSAGTANGLALQTSNSEIRALFINRFSGSGVLIQNGQGHVVAGCFLGTSPSGTAKLPNVAAGVTILTSRGNRIGGTNAADRNLLSGNQSGVWISGLSATGNVVQGNFIGTDVTGTASLGNGNNGVLLGAPGNVIGGTTPGSRNIISGNGQSGVYLNDIFATNNVVAGNFIGTAAGGTAALSNTVDGVTLFRASHNRIGGSQPGAGNVISGNGERGVYVFTTDANAARNVVEGNLIGTDLTGRTNLGNRFSGLGITLGTFNTIGGTNPASRNVISGNRQSGVAVDSNSVANVVLGNFIGLDVTGSNALPNLINGVTIIGGLSNVIGGTAAGAGNVISGNATNGIRLAGGSATIIQGNRIGTDVSGRTARGNGADGIRINRPGNVIGGETPGARNIISGNGAAGVYLLGVAASNNIVAGNFIGTDVLGAAAIPNGTGGASPIGGISLDDAPRNSIGTTGPGGGNLISGNQFHAVYLVGGSATQNRFQGNFIGTDVTGTLPVPNVIGGIYLYSAPTNYIGGREPGAGNLISGNTAVAISIGDPGANGNVIHGNFLGPRIDGVAPLANRWHGVEINFPCSGNIVGGTTPGEGNRIAYANFGGYDGVRVRHDVPGSAVANPIRGNTIFANAELAIDLGGGGVTANDSNDGDTGANNLQNFPVITAATGRYITVVSGTLNSRANAPFTLDFYTIEPGQGQGGRPLGRGVVTTIGNNASFTFTFTNTIGAGALLSATSTDAAGNTSEYSATSTLPPAPDTDLDGMPDDFETAFGLNPLLPDDDADKDGDGASNLREFLAGTRPDDASDVLRITLSREGGQTFLHAPSVEGVNYQFEAAHDVTGPWTSLGASVPGTGDWLRAVDLTTAPHRFFKVRAN